MIGMPGCQVCNLRQKIDRISLDFSRCLARAIYIMHSLGPVVSLFPLYVDKTFRITCLHGAFARVHCTARSSTYKHTADSSTVRRLLLLNTASSFKEREWIALDFCVYRVTT